MFNTLQKKIDELERQNRILTKNDKNRQTSQKLPEKNSYPTKKKVVCLADVYD
jgi:hypothetical protein